VAKAQELIQGSRVRALIGQQSDIGTAFFGFHDRYRALPGDYRAASANINCGAAPCLDGDGTGRIQASNSSNGNSGNHTGNGNGTGITATEIMVTAATATMVTEANPPRSTRVFWPGPT
jgi:hypothetical protein